MSFVPFVSFLISLFQLMANLSFLQRGYGSGLRECLGEVGVQSFDASYAEICRPRSLG